MLLQTQQNFNSGIRLNKENLNQHYSQIEVNDAQDRITEQVRLRKRGKKNPNESNNILTCLKNHFIFYNLTEAEIQNVKERMYYTEVDEDHVIYSYNDLGTCFFIVDKGKLELISEDKSKKRTLKPLDGFGQLALLYNTQRNSEVVSVEPSSLWVIDRVSFRQAVEEMIVREYTENKKCFEGVRFFANLTPDQKDIIASSLIRQKFYKGQVIIQEGDPGSTFYYLKQGSASVYKAGKFQRKLAKGDSFGEQSLYYNTMRLYTIKADEDVVSLVLGRDTLNRIMGDNIYEVTFKNFIRWAFEKNSTLNQLTREVQERIIDEMKISSFKAQESIFKRGVVGFQKLVVVVQGSLKKVKSGTIVASKGQCFGEDFLKDSTKILDDEIIMHTYGVIAEISDTAFAEAVGGANLKQLLAQKKQLNIVILERMQSKNTNRLQLKNVPLSDLRVTRLLSSKNQFGPLYIVNHGLEEFILKVIDKEDLVKYQVQEFAIEQGRVLTQINCPFVMSVYLKMQSQNYIFYINELVKGSQLYEVLKSIGLLSTQDSQFYTATIVLMLEYFAQKGVICRDIKPQNFMVDTEGYLKLINMPTAKLVQRDNQGTLKKTFTIIGTPHYMAPDIVIGKGYTNMVDLWSLGICLYEFLCGILPFGDSSQSAYEIYQEIMQTQLKFPEFLHDKKAKKLIQQLLSHNPNQRHGGSFQSLKKHSWFDGFNWTALLQRRKEQLKPPARPLYKELCEKRLNLGVDELIKHMENEKPMHVMGDKWSRFSEIIQ